MLDISKINVDPWNYKTSIDRKKKNFYNLIREDPYNLDFVRKCLEKSHKTIKFTDYLDILENIDIYKEDRTKQKTRLLQLHYSVVEGTSEYNALALKTIKRRYDKLIKKNKEQEAYQFLYNNLQNTNFRFYEEYLLSNDNLNISSDELKYLPRFHDKIPFKKISEILEVMYSKIFTKKDKIKLLSQQLTYIRNRFSEEDEEIFKKFLDKESFLDLDIESQRKLVNLWYNYRRSRKNIIANSLDRIKRQANEFNMLYRGEK